MNYDNYYKKGGMTKEESISAIALRIGARKDAVEKFVEEHKIDTDKLNADLKSKNIYFMDVITAIVGKPNNKYQKEVIKKYGNKMAMGGKTQGYDDREDERLGMKYGKMSGKDFVGSHEMREHSRRDDARFEERMEKGGKLYTTQMNVGRAKYVVNYHDGSKTHKDGSPFYDIDIFSNRKDFDKAVKKLESEGYKYRYADGGMMADGGETERDKNGMLYALQEHVSSGEIASKTNASKYVDIDQIRSKAIQYYVENGDKPYSYAELESVLKKFDHTKMANGGIIEDQYVGRTAQDIWDSLSELQRQHFIGDHALEIEMLSDKNFDDSKNEFPKEMTREFVKKAYRSDWEGLDEVVQNRFANHVRKGEYAKGGIIKVGDKVRSKIFSGVEGEVVSKKGDMLFIVRNNALPNGDMQHDVLRINEVEKLAKGGETKNKWEYTDVDEIDYVIVKDKSGKVLKFDGKYVISGVHDLLEKGGKLTEIGKYYSKNDVVSVEVNGKNILDKNTVSGVWIKKDAKPMAEDVADIKIGKTTIKKGVNGWVAKTMVDNFKGFDWDITTIKNSRGDLTTTAQGGKSEDKGGYKTFTFMVFQDPAIRLKSSRPARVTDKVVSAQHEEAMKDFKERQDEIAEMVDQIQAKKKMADGGAIGFDALAKKVAKNYEGDKVKKEYQKEYGKTYDKQEAEEVGKKVAAKVYRQQQAKGKMAKGGTTNNRSNSKMTQISRKASEIRKANESWKDAFNRAKAMIG